MRHQGVGGGLLAASILVASAAPAQTLLERPLWQFLEPEMSADLGVVADPLFHLAKSYGPTGSPNGSTAPAQTSGDWSESEYGSLGCIIGGTVGTVAAVAIGGPNIINLIAGGVVPAATPGALYTALAGVVFASFCAVGQAATPVVLLAYRSATTAFAANEPAPAPGQPRNEPSAPLLGRLIKTSFEP